METLVLLEMPVVSVVLVTQETMVPVELVAMQVLLEMPVVSVVLVIQETTALAEPAAQLVTQAILAMLAMLALVAAVVEAAQEARYVVLPRLLDLDLPVPFRVVEQMVMVVQAGIFLLVQTVRELQVTLAVLVPLVTLVLLVRVQMPVVPELRATQAP